MSSGTALVAGAALQEEGQFLFTHSHYPPSPLGILSPKSIYQERNSDLITGVRALTFAREKTPVLIEFGVLGLDFYAADDPVCIQISDDCRLFGNSATRRLGFGPSFWGLFSLLLKCCASFSSCLDVMHRDPKSIHVVSQHLTEKLC